MSIKEKMQEKLVASMRKTKKSTKTDEAVSKPKAKEKAVASKPKKVTNKTIAAEKQADINAANKIPSKRVWPD